MWFCVITSLKGSVNFLSGPWGDLAQFSRVRNAQLKGPEGVQPQIYLETRETGNFEGWTDFL